MITKYDLIHSYKKTEQNPSVKYKVSDDGKYLVSKESGEVLSTIEDAFAFFCKKLHCYFEGIYHEHASLLDVIRCRECGTVIFTFHDERYDPNLCCPVCANYETYFDYYTEDDIKTDRKAHDIVEFYKRLGKEQAEDDKRYFKTGLYPHELWKREERSTVTEVIAYTSSEECGERDYPDYI